jgi:hypothetical protein
MLMREAADVLHRGGMLVSLTAYIDRWEKMTARPDEGRQAPTVLLEECHDKPDFAYRTR